jgi:hypothetical protein
MNSAARLALAAAALTGIVLSAPAVAQYVGGGSIGAAGGGGTMSAAAILTQLLTVDGAASTLDADTLDAIDSTGLCQLANTDGLLCTFDNTDGTPDVRAATNDIFEIRTAGTGTILLATDYIGLGEESGTVRGYLITSSSGTLMYNNTDTAILLDGTSTGAWIGDRNNRAASVVVGGIADVISASYTETPLLAVYGSGLTSAPAGAVQTCDCGTTGTPNTVTCDITSKVVRLTDGDADACTVTFATTTADLINEDLIGVRIVVDSVGGGGTFDLADQAGIMELTGAYSMGVNDTLTVSYYAGSLDAWQEEARSNL